MPTSRRLFQASVFLLVAVLLPGTRASRAESSAKITILYDNTTRFESCRPDWGFACLIEATEKVVLFDTGAKGDILLKNAESMKIDLSSAEVAVISHAHADHTGGLQAALSKMHGPRVFLPFSSPASLVDAVRRAGAKPVREKDWSAVCKDVFLTGVVGIQIREQALVIRTPRGLVMVTGCSHPGIVSMVRKAREAGKMDVFAVIGGFHLLQLSEPETQKVIADLRQLGVREVGATHCTGPAQIEQFRKAYGAGFLEMGVGRVIRFD